MTKIYAVANNKGGVGKTTTTMSLGAALAQNGKRVLLVDTDQQGDLSKYLGFDGNGATIAELLLATSLGRSIDVAACIRHSDAEQLDYIPAKISLADVELQLVGAMGRETVLRRSLQNKLFAEYDYILIDCPPSLGTITINSFAAADRVLIPLELENFAFTALGALLEVLQLVKQTINPGLELGGILKTKQDRSKMSTAICAALEQQYGDAVYTTSISRAKEAANSSYSCRSLVSYRNKLGEQYKLLADELLAREGDK